MVSDNALAKQITCIKGISLDHVCGTDLHSPYMVKIYHFTIKFYLDYYAHMQTVGSGWLALPIHYSDCMYPYQYYYAVLYPYSRCPSSNDITLLSPR